MRINHQWRRFMAVGCNHGYWADPTALAGVLQFKDSFKPVTRIHLGDYMDTTSLRSGASYKDHKGNILEDLQDGINFLTDFEPTILFNGNHDIRVWQQLDSTDAPRRAVTSTIVNQVEGLVKKLRCDFEVEHKIYKSIRQIGDTKLLHGFMYNDNAIKDHAAKFGKCIIAHLHKVGMSPASRIDSPVGYCVGYLGDKEKFEYAERRPATFQWSQGFAWGEYSDSECIIYLCERNKEGAWRFPV
jgi:hypothetical protein